MSDGTYEFSEHLQITPEGAHFVSKCLQFDEQNRASISDIMDENYVINKKWSPEK